MVQSSLFRLKVRPFFFLEVTETKAANLPLIVPGRLVWAADRLLCLRPVLDFLTASYCDLYPTPLFWCKTIHYFCFLLGPYSVSVPTNSKQTQK